jgi:hypothetical protein
MIGWHGYKALVGQLVGFKDEPYLDN